MDRIVVRSAIVRVLFVVLLALVGLAGSAHAATPGFEPGDLKLAGALYTPERAEDGFDWHAQWVLTPESATELASEGPHRIRFAIPLGDDEALGRSPKVAPWVEAGKTVGVVVDEDALDGRIVSAVVHQRSPHEGRIRMGAPVGAGTALQIIDGDLGAGTRLEVDGGRTLERNVGNFAPTGTSHAARDEARRLTGYAARVTGAAIYVRGDDVVTMNGLSASVVTPRTRGHRGVVAAFAVFALLVGVLLAGMRKLGHAARAERADALLAAEVDALETPRSAVWRG